MTRLSGDITRRDFLNGAALSVAAGALPPAMLAAARAEAGLSYPPAQAGLRGAHAGAFEIAHQLAWSGKRWPAPEQQTDDIYDLVVVGAGLSGLAAAHEYRRRAGPATRILILDNHDDFGGHARRNEFIVDGRVLIGYGGSQSIDGPRRYSTGAKRVLNSLGVETKEFHDWFDQTFYARLGMGHGLFLDKDTFGADALGPSPFGGDDEARTRAAPAAIEALPIDDASKASLRVLVTAPVDFFAGKSVDEKIAYLRSISFERFLTDHAGATATVVLILRKTLIDIWGAGWDVLSALEAARWNMPGTGGLGLADALGGEGAGDEPYIFHFPDGNASLARLLVRSLIPAAIEGSSIEDIVLARTDYEALDRQGAPVRLRLSATAVDIRNTGNGESVDIVYLREDAPQRVRARHCFMAGYLAMAPHLMPEMPEAQKEAVRFFTKIPLVYVNVALRNWRAFEKAGVHRIYSSGAFYEAMALDFPVSIGAYKFSKGPDDPILLHVQHIPIAPGRGLNEKDQHREGRRSLLALSYDDYERALVSQLTAMLGPHGFDAERDIAGITVNRWPHGYAYEYNELFDDPEWSPDNGPHLKAREKIGRISIANSDASAYAYVDGAFDAALRAVEEQLSA
ncbi:MAG: NAD(P)-binding protein [Parvularculaceae bacterium]